MTERMGYWVDMSQAYWTMDPAYVESVWWSLKQIFDKGLLVQDHRVAPYCPRCGTGLSDHELAQGYETVVDPSVYVRFPRHRRVRCAGPAPTLLVWTTTPVDAGVQHRGRRQPRRRPTSSARPATASALVVAEPLLRGGARRGRRGPRRRFTGRELERRTYTRARSTSSTSRTPTTSSLADYVTTEDGTGLVHQSPAFGADDLARRAARTACRWSTRSTRDGHFAADVPLVGGHVLQEGRQRPGRRPRGARAAVPARALRALATRTAGAATRRCSTTRSRPGTSAPPASRTTLLAREREDQLVPRRRSSTAATATGCTNNIDWALSRNRYWGTPLPIWRCDATEPPDRASGRSPSSARSPATTCPTLDPHRPFVDDVVARLPRLRRARPAACPRSSTAGTTPARCRSPSGATRTRRQRGAVRAAATRRTSSARRSTRRAAGSTR